MKKFTFFFVVCLGWLVIFVILTDVVIYLGTRKHIYGDAAASPNAEIVLIPGAAVRADGALSEIFLDRADTAIGLYEAEKVSKILVSGDNSSENYNEVNPVRLFLLSKGIPEEDIFLDHAGFDTYSSMYRARDVFEVSSLLITTQSFHLPRAVFIARQLGMEAYGVRTDIESVPWRNHLREILANEKALLDLLFKRKPKYLGEEIPITEEN